MSFAKAICNRVFYMDQPQIHVLAEHSEKENASVVTVTYGGAAFDPMDSDNELSYAVLKSTTAEMTYTFASEEDLPNRVKLRIK